MAENSRLEDLRRRVQKDPASIAFAQLAEECRRAGAFEEAVDTCRAGLKIHPGYLSARVTLGRALIELNDLDGAQAELSRVLESAPENLAAIRGLAEIFHRRGDLPRALVQYRAALLLARNDPDLEETIDDLTRQVEPAQAAAAGGLTMQHMQDELLKRTPSSPKAPAPEHSPQSAQSTESSNSSAFSAVSAEEKGDGSHLPAADLGQEPAQTGQFGGQGPAQTTPVPFSSDPPEHSLQEAQSTESSSSSAFSARSAVDVSIESTHSPAFSAASAVNVAEEKGDGSHFPAAEVGQESAQTEESWGQVPAETTPVPISADLAVDVGTKSTHSSAFSAASAVNVASPGGGTLTAASDDLAMRTVAVLEQWLAAIHVSREERHP